MSKIQAIKNSNWTLVALLLIQVALGYWLITGNSILVKELIPRSNLAAGTIIAWLFLFSFPLLTYLFLEKVEYFFHPILLRMLKRLGIMAIVCGGLWGVISYFLASNWQFTFTSALENQEARVQAFRFISILPVFTSLIIALVIAIGAVVAVFNQKKET